MREIESEYLTCPYCNFSYSITNFFFVDKGEAKCDKCNNVFEFEIKVYRKYKTNTMTKKEE